MKNFICTLLSFLNVCIAFSQSSTTSRFLFDEYIESLIFYKDGRQFTAPVNYDLIAGCFLFIDATDNEVKEFTYPDLISFLKIGNRSFLIGPNEAIEIVQNNPLFHVHYIGKTRRAPKKTSYGGTTQTAAVDSYSSLSGNGLIGGKQTDDRILIGIHKNYEIEIKKKRRFFYHKQSLIKLLPKEEREKWNTYIENQSIDFQSEQQVLQLYLHIIHNDEN